MKNEKTIRKAVLLGLGGYQYLKEEFEDFIKDLEKDGKITSEEGKKLVDEVMEDGKKLASKGTSEIRDVLQKIFNEVGIATSGDMDKLQEEVKKISKVSKII